MSLRRGRGEYPHLYSIPYPSSVVWRTDVPLPRISKMRPMLMLFIGLFNHGDVPVREMIQKQCAGYKDERLCKVLIPRGPRIATAAERLLHQKVSTAQSTDKGTTPIILNVPTADTTAWDPHDP